MRRFIVLAAAALALAGCSHTSQEERGAAPFCHEGLAVDHLVYAVKGTDTLTVDIFHDPEGLTGEPRPLLIYLFGGGFESGVKEVSCSDIVCFTPYFAHLGYVSVTIDYRLEFAKARRELRVPETTGASDLDSPDFICCQEVVDEFTRANLAAVEDLMDVTTFLIGLAGRYNIDPEKVIAVGSSAGALTCLGAEYCIANGREVAKTHLPEGFDYACIVPMAGGIYTRYGEEVKFASKPCPMLLFHGDADELVPYTRYEMPQYGATFHGSREIADLLAEMKVPYTMYTVEGGNHVVNGSPMVTNRDDIHAFIRRTVEMKTPWAVEIVEKSLTVPHDYKWIADEHIMPLIQKHPEYASQLESGEDDDPHRPTNAEHDRK